MCTCCLELCGAACESGYFAGLRNTKPRRSGVFAASTQPKPGRITVTQLLTNNDFAFDFDFNAAMRLLASDLSLSVLLLTNDARNRLGFAHAEGFDLVFSNAFASQVGGDSGSATL